MPVESSSRLLLPLRSDATDLPPAQAGTSSLVPYPLLVQCLSSPLPHFKPGTPTFVSALLFAFTTIDVIRAQKALSRPRPSPRPSPHLRGELRWIRVRTQF